MVAGLSGIEFAFAFAAVAIGALVQGSIGFAFVLISAPVLGLMQPKALPATFLLLIAPMGIWMALRERSAIDFRGFGEMLGGRLFGTALGAWVLVVVSDTVLAVLIGVAVITAVALSAVASEFEAGVPSRIAAGGVSGLMSTVAAAGGPAMALAYQSRSASELRSTIALSAVLGSALSLGAVIFAGRLAGWHATLAAALFPAEVIGLWLSGRVVRMADQSWMRPAVLTFAALGGATLIVRALV